MLYTQTILSNFIDGLGQRCFCIMQGKVIFIMYKKLERFEYEKYGGRIFEKYFDVEVWNLPKIFLNENVPIPQDVYRGINVQDIDSIKEFINTLRHYNRKKTFVICNLPPLQRKTYYMETVISTLGFQYGMLFCQPFLAQWNTGTLKDDFKCLKKDKCNAFLNAIFSPTFNFAATSINYRDFPSVWSIKRQNNILIHTLDYDIYLKIKDERKRLIEDKYIIFIDESYVAHDDYAILGVNTPFKNPEDYYAPMRKLFDMIERLYGYRVVIAEHPRAHYPDSSMYGNREMIRGQTARLIRDAEMILCHTSTAIDYIILFKKKFLLIYLDEIKKFYEWDAYYIPLFKYLRIKALNVSKDYDIDKIKKMISSGESATCRKYKQRFIKQRGTKEEPFFEIVSENILSYFKRNEGS